MNFLARKRQAAPFMTLEGVVGPNQRLDQADAVSVQSPDTLCPLHDGRLLLSSGRQVLALNAWGGEPEFWAAFAAPVTALAQSPGGRVAVGLGAGGLAVLDADGRPVAGWSHPIGQLASVIDLVFRTDDELILVDCGRSDTDDLLSAAAWDDEARGQVVSLRHSGELRVILPGLHYPMGVCLDAKGGLLVSLLERAAIVDETGRVLQAGYPGYAGRLRRHRDGYVLACLSRRDPLVEFLKSEPAFVAEMKATIAPRHWIGPRLDAAFSHDLPIELGATRLYGEVKPWAPSFSYGLLVTLDDALMPTGSAQSRADGRRHAIGDVASWGGSLLATSRASGEILKIGDDL
ncbi:hypothetical protein [Aureimonas jatrophae]|uniref:Strictosidine synthase n=1 Tax=Aureimonas jatrophae TaxID=1166073 RepID=A0A1H0KD61_9HYPH|nr:hypothetical protein [Aureimonas jatrophae]MBB3951065.1 hypothetical protein [Aureimonas jatrophae]SDO53721.1 hypothetical protein SAMN05192530_107212 [Aureimonas jatrophae]